MYQCKIQMSVFTISDKVWGYEKWCDRKIPEQMKIDALYATQSISLSYSGVIQ